MASKSKNATQPDEECELKAEIRRLADTILILTNAVEGLVTELQWRNNELSQDYGSQHLPLTRLPTDPTTPDWHPVFGDGQRTPIPAAAGVATKPRLSRLFD